MTSIKTHFCNIRLILLLIFYTIILLSGCATKSSNTSALSENAVNLLSKEVILLMRNLDFQMANTRSYDASYVPLQYPNGDVPINTGVCADVIIRAFRAIDIDLQKEIHVDMKRHFLEYPNIWNLKHADRNIDHRRVPNLMKFFERKGKSRICSTNSNDYKPGDIVAWRLDNGKTHIGIVCADIADEGDPYIVHNIGRGARKQNVLFDWKIIGHYRWFN